MLLMIAVLVQYQQHARDIRQLSRAVFLLLYLLFGVNQIASLQPHENLRDYLAYGVFALLTVHALGAVRGVNVRRQRARQMNQARSSVADEAARPWPQAPVQNQR
jgi:hypothetical protein